MRRCRDFVVHVDVCVCSGGYKIMIVDKQELFLLRTFKANPSRVYSALQRASH